MDPRPQATTHDPELDPPALTAGPRGRPALYPEEYQRLVANPFLALFGLIVLLYALRMALAIRSLLFVGVAACGLPVVARLLHYHCRDCGSTGRLFQWKSHACASVLARQQMGRTRRFRGPNPYIQLVLWIYALVSAGILLTLVLRSVGP